LLETLTGVVDTETITYVAPAETVACDGMLMIAGFEVVSDTALPPAGAGPVRYTSKLTHWPPTVEEGSVRTLCNTAGWSVRVQLTACPSPDTVILALLDTLTGVVDTETITYVAPAETVACDGMPMIAGFEVVSDTALPPAGAGPVRYTSRLTHWPPRVEEGSVRTLCNTAGWSVRVQLTACPSPDTVILALLETLTGFVDTETTTYVAPAGTVACDGMPMIAGFEVLSDTVLPPAGAGTVRYTSRFTHWPPTVEEGSARTLCNTAAGWSVRVQLSACPSPDTVILALLETLTGFVDTETTTYVAPAGTVACDGMPIIAEFEVVSDTALPPAGAGPVKYTLRLTTWPPTTLEALVPTDFNAGAATCSSTDCDAPPAVAVIVTSDALTTGEVGNGTRRTLSPAVTVTCAGIAIISARDPDNTRTAPEDGAGALIVTTKVASLPPIIVSATKDAPATVGSETVLVTNWPISKAPPQWSLYQCVLLGARGMCDPIIIVRLVPLLTTRSGRRYSAGFSSLIYVVKSRTVLTSNTQGMVDSAAFTSQVNVASCPVGTTVSPLISGN
jgi:hypothetical protein